MRFALFFSVMFLIVLSGANALSPNVIISEVAWMGTTINSADEWIELWNPSNEPVLLEGWKILANDGTPSITLSGTVPAQGFFLLERSDDETLPNVSADQIYTGALGNSSELIRLFDSSNTEIDSVDATGGWFGGDNDTKQTLERQSNGSWGTSTGSGGTPKEQNSIWETFSSPPPPAEPIPAPAPPPPQPPSELQPVPPSPSETIEPPTEIPAPQILLWELLPDPQGSDADGEFIELRNEGTTETDVSGWKLKDASGASRTLQGIIAAKGYLLLQKNGFPSLNNEGDSIDLLDDQGARRDALTYQEAPEGYSVARSENAWRWTATPTPGQENIFSSPNLAPSISSPIGLEAPIFSNENTASEKEKTPTSKNSESSIKPETQYNGGDIAKALRAEALEAKRGSHALLYGIVAATIAGGLVFALRVVLKRQKSPNFIEED